MDRFGLIGGVLLLALAAGCLGAGGDEATEAGFSVIENRTTDEASSSNQTGSSANEEDPTSKMTDACQGVRENVTTLLEAKDEDPFGDRPPLKPRLDACGHEGVFLLAAHGLEGTMALELTWSFPESASCETFEGAAATGGHHQFHVDGWDHAQADPTVGFGTAGGGSEIFAGPVDSEELREEGNGKTAWAGASEIDLAKGEHSFVAATNGWGSWDNGLTEGAALLQIRVCDGSFSFEGARTASSLHLFSHHDMDQGAGAIGPRFSGASAGQALDVELGEEARLRAGGFAFAGAGAMQIADAETEDRHTFGPEEPLRVVQDVPEGPLTVTQARGGALVVTAGAVYGGMTPIAEGAIVGES